jgi:hypothetical protein
MTDTTPRFRAGTVVWGAVLLAVAAITFSVAVFGLGEFQSAWIIWILIGVGAIFVVAALVSLLVRAVSKPEPAVEDAATEIKDQPVD